MSLTLKPGKLSHEPALGWTPSGAVDPYTVQVVGSHPYVCNVALAANERGSLLPRGGTYIATSGAMDVAPTAGAALMFVPGASGGTLMVITDTSAAAGSYKHFGRVAPGSTITEVAGDTYEFEVEHDPNGEVIVDGS